jgi:hypothetical protein
MQPTNHREYLRCNVDFPFDYKESLNDLSNDISDSKALATQCLEELRNTNQKNRVLLAKLAQQKHVSMNKALDMVFDAGIQQLHV